MPDLMKYKFLYLLFSVFILIPGIFFISTGRLTLSRDFLGGSYVEFELTKDFNEKDFAFSNQEKVKLNGKVLEVEISSGESVKLAEIVDKIKTLDPEAKELSSEVIGPVVGQETTANAFKALALACGGILLYIGFAFRAVPKPYSGFRFGVSAIVAMIHDALMLLGIFAIFSIPIDSLFITAMLTVIGFSVHDSIVVFDRIRENLKKLPGEMTFEGIVNFSLVETLNRSVATSLTVIISLLSLYVLGGETIKNFVLALLVGIISGTYSSIFTASPLLVIWEDFIKAHKK